MAWMPPSACSQSASVISPAKTSSSSARAARRTAGVEDTPCGRCGRSPCAQYHASHAHRNRFRPCRLRAQGARQGAASERRPRRRRRRSRDRRRPSTTRRYARPAAQLVAEGDAERGVLVCGSGVGVAIVANKVPGVRAVNAHDAEEAQLSRAHNDVERRDPLRPAPRRTGRRRDRAGVHRGRVRGRPPLAPRRGDRGRLSGHDPSGAVTGAGCVELSLRGEGSSTHRRPRGAQGVSPPDVAIGRRIGAPRRSVARAPAGRDGSLQHRGHPAAWTRTSCSAAAPRAAGLGVGTPPRPARAASSSSGSSGSTSTPAAGGHELRWAADVVATTLRSIASPSSVAWPNGSISEGWQRRRRRRSSAAPRPAGSAR